MRIGILLNSAGQVKRTFSLISGEAAVPVEHGDELIEWEMPHGGGNIDTAEHGKQVLAANTIQAALSTLKQRDEALALHGGKPEHGLFSHRQITFASEPDTSIEVLYRSDGRIATRQKGESKFPDGLPHGRLETVKKEVK